MQHTLIRGFFAIMMVYSATSSAYEVHFGVESANLSETARKAVDDGNWKLESEKRGNFGRVIEYVPEGYVPRALSVPGSVSWFFSSLLVIVALNEIPDSRRTSNTAPKS